MPDAWRFKLITVFEKLFMWVLATRASHLMQYLKNIVSLVETYVVSTELFVDFSKMLEDCGIISTDSFGNTLGAIGCCK